MRKVLTFLLALSLTAPAFGPASSDAAEAGSRDAGAAERDGAGELAQPTRPVLRQAVTVDNDVVHLGDLFDNLTKGRDRAVFYAPRPGRSVILNAERLRDIAIRHRLRWRPRQFERVVISRASQVIGAEAIVAEVRGLLGEEAQSDDLWVELDNNRVAVHIPASMAPSIAIKNFRYDRASRRFTGLLQAPAEAPTVVQPVSGQVFRTAEVPVLKRRLRKSQIIAEDDIEWISMRSDRVSRNVITDAGDLIGKAPRRPLTAGSLIRMADVREPVLVAKGNTVTMVYKTRFMTLTARGKALDDGSRGATVRVMNPQSKRVVEAKVVSADRVVAETLGAVAADE